MPSHPGIRSCRRYTTGANLRLGSAVGYLVHDTRTYTALGAAIAAGPRVGRFTFEADYLFLNLSEPGLRGELDLAYGRVMDSGWMILGPELAAFEAEFAAWCGAAMRALPPPGTGWPAPPTGTTAANVSSWKRARSTLSTEMVRPPFFAKYRGRWGSSASTIHAARRHGATCVICWTGQDRPAQQNATKRNAARPYRH